MNIANWLHSSARINPDAPALMTGTQLVSNYQQFAHSSSSIAQGLCNQFDIKTGSHIGLVLENCVEYLEALYAIWYAGAVAVPINAKLHPKEAGWILNNAEAKLVITDRSDRVSQLQKGIGQEFPRQLQIFSEEYSALKSAFEYSTPVQKAEDDLAWLFYTSGTTGRPKGVMLSHANLVAMSLCYQIDVDQVLQSDAALYAAPISHGAGLYNFIHVRKAARHIVPKSRGFNGDEILDLSSQMENVSLFAAPTMVRRLVDCAKRRNLKGEGIKTIVYGGGPMYRADIEEAVDNLGDRFVQIYGQGESPMTISALSRRDIADRNHPNWKSRLASVGIAHSCIEIRIADTNGESLPPGEIGEVYVRGATVMSGYWRNPEATAETLTDGWLHTGDIGSLDQDGYLTLTDRSKDVIISGGANIYPREVEEVLSHHESVHEIAVIGRADSDWGEAVIAFIVPEAGHEVSAETLDTFCLENMARFKRPKLYYLLNELPKNNYGKVLKTELRKLEASLSDEAALASPMTSNKVKNSGSPGI